MADILIEKDTFFYNVKLNRPEKHNAFTAEMIVQLTEFFATASKDKFARAILLNGAGASFCAGADLNWMKSMVNFKLKENQADSKALFEMYEAAKACALPIVGNIHGAAYGGGVGLVSICDIAIAEINTKFCFSEVRLGLVPAVISSFVLDKMAVGKARELMLTGRVFTAEEAYQSGLVDFVGRELEAKNFLKETLRHLSQNGPEAVREVKRLLGIIRTSDAKTRKTESINVISERRVSDEGQEGLKSFLEGRAPAWAIPVADDNAE